MKATILVASALLALGSVAYAQSKPPKITIPNQGSLATPTDNGTGPAVNTTNENASGMGGSTRGGDDANGTNQATQPNISNSPNTKSDYR
jgi:hypothetical protein